MGAIRLRLVAVVVAAVLGWLTTWLGAETAEELAPRVEAAVEGAFAVALLGWYAVVHPWLQKRKNPTGAYTSEAAERLEAFGHITKPAQGRGAV